MGTLNYSSIVAACKTASEMSKMLAEHGAQRVTVMFDAGQHVGLEFTLATPHGPREFSLPIDVNAVQNLLDKEVRARKIQKRYATTEQAERTAWRVAKDWLAAQLAIIEAQMATLDEVMLPYLIVEPGPNRKTLYTRYREAEDAALALTTGKTDG